LKYLHKGGAGTRAAAWYGSGSSKMILLWLWFGQLQLTGVETKVFVFELNYMHFSQNYLQKLLRRQKFHENFCLRKSFCKYFCVLEDFRQKLNFLK
jgi:hypothetical protein